MIDKVERKTKRVKAGTSRAQVAERSRLFVEAYVTNGGNATEAAKTAGFAPRSAHVAGSRLIKGAKVAAAIKERQAAALASAQRLTDLTAIEVLESLARDIRFDPAKLYREDGSLKPIHEMDEDTRLALRGAEIDEIALGCGDERTVVGHTTKVKFPEKTSAREQGMKHFGLYDKDKDRPAELHVHLPGVKSIKFEPLSGRRTG
jgi:phage terminase small subunit